MLPKTVSLDDNSFSVTLSSPDAWAQEEGCTHERI
jgi:hypothetical protein